MNKSLSNEMYHALILRYETEIQECKTSLLIYFNNPVGIGDHPNHLEEMDRLLINMSSANDKLGVLKSTFSKLKM